MTTLAATTDTTRAAVNLQIDAAGASVHVYRQDPDGTISEVRGSPFVTQAGSATVRDNECPLDDPVTYTADGATATVTLVIGRPWLTHPSAPFLSQGVTVQADRDWTWAAKTFEFDVIDRPDPVYVYYHRATRSGTLVLRWHDPAERSRLNDLLIDGAPILLRIPNHVACGLDSGWLGLGEARVTFDQETALSGLLEVDYRVVSAPGGEPQGDPDWQWQDLPAERATWAAVYAAYTSWRTLLLHDNIPGTTRHAGRRVTGRFAA